MELVRRVNLLHWFKKQTNLSKRRGATWSWFVGGRASSLHQLEFCRPSKSQGRGEELKSSINIILKIALWLKVWRCGIERYNKGSMYIALDRLGRRECYKAGWNQKTLIFQVALVELENSKSEHMLLYSIENGYKEEVHLAMKYSK